MATSVDQDELRGLKQWDVLCERAANLGYTSILTPPLWSTVENRLHGAPDDPDRPDSHWFQLGSMSETLAILSERCARYKLFLLMDLVLDTAVANGVLASRRPDWYENADGPAGIRMSGTHAEIVQLRLCGGRAPAGLMDEWAARLDAWAAAGVAGFRSRNPAAFPADDWSQLIHRVCKQQTDCRFLAFAPDLTQNQLESLADAGFVTTLLQATSQAYQALWLAQNHDRWRALSTGTALSARAKPATLNSPDEGMGAGGRRIEYLNSRACGTWHVAMDGIRRFRCYENTVPHKLDDADA
ncbi:MAG: hypothetical protein EPN62_11185 [Candidimonas sp.]|nr:MAG: hypothetical protein EPN77_09625 [Candidimonas sp.]TAM22701.1 MAG: hypothetical protein EPN62_11185 [Candidimonas sp.]